MLLKSCSKQSSKALNDLHRLHNSFGLCLNQLSNEANDSTKTKSYYLKLDKELSEEINDNTLEIAKIYQNIVKSFYRRKIDSALKSISIRRRFI